MHANGAHTHITTEINQITHNKMKKALIFAILCIFCIGAQAQDKPYEVKSGIVTMEMDMMGQKVVQELYFDDYGAKQATISEFQGRKMRGLEVNGENLMIDDETNTAMRMPGMGMGGEKINFADKSEKNIKKNKIKELGEEEYIGLPCQKYSYRVMTMGGAMTTYVWVYKGITLKTSMKTDFGEMGMGATKLQEDVEIDPAMFTVPEGITIQEMRRPAGPPQGFDF